jgi:hypothetical protein
MGIAAKQKRKSSNIRKKASVLRKERLRLKRKRLLSALDAEFLVREQLKENKKEKLSP